MTQKEFYALYSDEQYCQKVFKDLRITSGVTCKKCNGKSHYWMQSKNQFRCKNRDCRFDTTLKSGTILQDSKLSFSTWFEAIFLMFNTKKGMSIKELQRQMGIEYYQVAHALSHKIRKGASLILKDLLYEASIERKVEQDQGKSTNSPVNFKMLFSKQSEVGIGYIRFIQFNYQKSLESISARQPKFKIFDQSSYSDEPDCKVESEPYWFNTIFNNAKRVISGIHHHVSDKYQQFYLDEYCLKLNLRKQSLPWHEVLKITIQSY